MFKCEYCSHACSTGVVYGNKTFEPFCAGCIEDKNNRKHFEEKKGKSVKVSKTKLLSDNKIIKEKKPKNAYMWFTTENRERIRVENPYLIPSDLIKKIAIEWKSISSEDKEKYIILAEGSREEYMKVKEESKKLVDNRFISNLDD
jgi:hypothetical protein